MIFASGDYELDEEHFELRCAGDRVPVQPKVMEALLLLVRSHERVVLKQELQRALWPDVNVTESSIARVIMEARKAISDELQQIIVTVRGRGFRFAGPVSTKSETTRLSQRTVRDPSFVGRSAELASVEARIEEALEGKGSIVWLSGEAGIGKSRLSEEIARSAEVRGMSVLVTRAHEGSEAPPFWSWTHLVEKGDLPGTAEALRALVSSEGDEFSRFAAFTRALLAACERPRLLVLDDLQWADPPSLRLLGFVTRHARDGALLLVGAYRDTALGADARGSALAEALRGGPGLTIPLRGFTLEEVSTYVECTQGTAPSPELAAKLQAHTAGNPLYVQHALASDWAAKALARSADMLASSMDLQRGIVESTLRHLAGLSERTRELLSGAAVLGGPFDLAKLALVTGCERAALLDFVDEAARGRILVADKYGSYRFAHPIVRDVLYKKLHRSERTARHLAIGEALLAHYAESAKAHAEELSHHFVRALPLGDAARAVDMALSAAEQKAELGSVEAAVHPWAQALAASVHLGGGDRRRLTAQLGLGSALTNAGRHSEAQAAFLDALVLARALERPVELARSALGLAALSGPSSEQRLAVLEEASAALRARAEEPELLDEVEAARIDPRLR